MKTIISYECPICGYRTDDKNECLSHDAGHYKLTPVEYERWLCLAEIARRATATRCVTNFPDTRLAEDKAIKELVDFEREHGLEKYGI